MFQFFSIVKRELWGYFTTPTLYVFSAIFLLLSAIFTFIVSGFFERGEASLSAPFFSWIPLLFAFFAPAIGMRTWVDENRAGTLDLLVSYPITMRSLVFAKFVAALLALTTPLALTVGFVITAGRLGDIDMGIVVISYLGSIFVGASFIAISCACSASSRNHIVAFILSAAICLLLVLLGNRHLSNEVINVFPKSEFLVDCVTAMATKPYFDGFRKGFMEYRSVLYFIMIIGASLLLNYHIVLRKLD